MPSCYTTILSRIADLLDLTGIILLHTAWNPMSVAKHDLIAPRPGERGTINFNTTIVFMICKIVLMSVVNPNFIHIGVPIFKKQGTYIFLHALRTKYVLTVFFS